MNTSMGRVTPTSGGSGLLEAYTNAGGSFSVVQTKLLNPILALLTVCLTATDLFQARCDQYCLDIGYDQGIVLPDKPNHCLCSDYVQVRKEKKLTLPAKFTKKERVNYITFD